MGDRGGGEFNERVGEEGKALRGTLEFTPSMKEMHSYVVLHFRVMCSS